MAQSPIRLPERDLVTIVQQTTDPAQIEKYLFNDIGGTELINLVRNDSVSGIKFNYSVISDLASVDLAFDPSSLLVNRNRYQSIFDQYGIKLATRIPTDNYFNENDYPPDSNVGTNIYYDEDGKNLVIEFDNMNSTEFIQIEVLMPSDNAKIYTVRENDY